MASPNASPEALPGPHDFASWKHPYKDACVYLHRDLVHRLSSQSVQHLNKDTEIGGILWGKSGPDESILILNVTPVTSSATLFNTNAVDTRNLTQTLNRPAPDPTLYPVGFFRSHLREGLALSPQDRALVTECLYDPDSVILLLKPFPAGICTAAFFFWNNGFLQDTSDLEVPFVFDDPAHPEAAVPPDRQEEASIVDLLRESALRQRTLHPVKFSPETIASARPRHSTKRSPWPTLLAAGLIALFLGIAGAAAVFLWPTLRSRLQAAGAAPSIGIGLQAVRDSTGHLQVTWNRNAPGIRNARGGMLIVNDGRYSPKLPLTPDQLRSGTLLYAPKTARVQFRLALDLDGGRTLTESVLISAAKRRPRTSASLRRPEPAASRASDPPPAGLDSLEAAPATAIPPDPPVVVSLSVPPSPRPHRASAAYVPPQAVQEMMPATAPAGQFAKIAIQVSLDPKGRVVAARAERHPAGNAALTAIALSAARQWRFQPATLDGKPVPAEYTIVFAFRPRVH